MDYGNLIKLLWSTDLYNAQTNNNCFSFCVARSKLHNNNKQTIGWNLADGKWCYSTQLHIVGKQRDDELDLVLRMYDFFSREI